jgi:hypothetical protein
MPVEFISSSQQYHNDHLKGQDRIAQGDAFEAITRPYVVRARNGFRMWFCFRGSQDFRDGFDACRIGYATSERWSNLAAKG